MTRQALNAAIEEAERFLLRAIYLRDIANEEKLDHAYYPKMCASINQASVDLTRALTDLREGR